MSNGAATTTSVYLLSAYAAVNDFLRRSKNAIISIHQVIKWHVANKYKNKNKKQN